MGWSLFRNQKFRHQKRAPESARQSGYLRLRSVADDKSFIILLTEVSVSSTALLTSFERG